MTAKTPNLRAASYSRYSSDAQRDTSIEDQQRLTDARAASEGWIVTDRFSDFEISASTPMALRAGGRAMLEAAARGAFDVLLIEGLDRCWRDIVDQERTIRRLEHQGIRIVGVSDGYDTRHEDRELTRGVRGLLNQQYLRDLAKKTHRGLTGQVFRGGHAGGLSFGYRSRDAGATHVLEVDAEQASWVRWIFERCADGWAFRRISAELNRLGVATGRGGTWAVSALYGSPAKGSGILNNELYVGRYIWNRSRWLTDPETGKRHRVDRPRNEWLVEDRQELRIVSDALWQDCRARIDAGRLSGGTRGRGAKPRTLFGGLLRCGKCGAAVVAVSQTTYGCSAHKDRGEAVCSGVRISRKEADRRLLSVFREDLMTPSAIARLQERVVDLVAARRRAAAAAKMTFSSDMAAVNAEIDRLVDAIAVAGHSDALVGRLRAAEARRAALVATADTTSMVPSAIDGLMSRYRRHLMDIANSLETDPDRARSALHDHFGNIIVEAVGNEVWATFDENPSRLLLRAAGDSETGCGGLQWVPESRRVRLE